MANSPHIDLIVERFREGLLSDAFAEDSIREGFDDGLHSGDGEGVLFLPDDHDLSFMPDNGYKVGWTIGKVARKGSER